MSTSWKIWLKFFAGLALFIAGSVAGFYQVTLHPATTEILRDPFSGMNLLFISLPLIAVSGIVAGVLIAIKATEQT